MSDSILDIIEKVNENSPNPIATWSAEDYEFLLSQVNEQAAISRETARREKHAKLRERARQQGVKPIKSIEDLRGDFWNEDESVDEFLDWVRTIRHSSNPRRLPE